MSVRNFRCTVVEVNGILVSPDACGMREGDKFGRLTLAGQHFYLPYSGARYWFGVFLCECGNTTVAVSKHVKCGNTKACGCMIAENGKKHGRSRERIYGVWQDMHKRCSNERCRAYKNYGARGIRVCEEWSTPEAFLEWATENGYSPGMELDRIDNDGNYEPGNCRFVTKKNNDRNRRTNVFLSAFGETKCIAEWVEDERCVVADKTLRERIKLGWTPERAITEPSHSTAGQAGCVDGDDH